MTRPGTCLLWISAALPAVAQEDGQVYWSGSYGLGRANLDGTGAEWIVEADTRRAESIAVDPRYAKVYWASSRGRGTVYRSNLDGADLEVLGTHFHRDCNPPADCSRVVDFQLEMGHYWGRIFFALQLTHGDYWTGAVAGLDLKKWDPSDESPDEPDDRDPYGTSLSRGRIGEVIPRQLSFNPMNGKLYILGHDASLRQIDADSLLTSRRGRIYHHMGYGLGDSVLYDYRHLCASKNNNRCAYASDIGLDYEEGLIYLAGSQGIQRAGIDGDAESISTLVDSADIRSVFVDVRERDLYWAEWNGEVWKSDLNGQDRILIIDVAESRYGFGRWEIEDFVVSEGKMYWVDSGGAVRRCNTDGSGVEDLFSPPVRSPAGLSLDASRGKVLWGDQLAGRVLQSNLDGSEIEVLVSGSVAVGDVLLANDRIYWSDNGTGKIQSAQRNGSNVMDYAEFLTGNWPVSLSFDSVRRRIYWSHGGSIRWTDLDGSGHERILIDEPYWVDDIEVDSEQGVIYWLDKHGIWSMGVDGSDRHLIHELGALMAWNSLALTSTRVHWTTVRYDGWGVPSYLYLSSTLKDGTDKVDTSVPDIRVLAPTFYRSLMSDFVFHYPVASTVSSDVDPPPATALHSIYPNPFNSSTRIDYTLSRSGPASLRVYNSLGQTVETLVHEVQAGGAYSVLWHASPGDASGVYFCWLSTVEGNLTRKLILLR